jgi:hypothetical protein
VRQVVDWLGRRPGEQQQVGGEASAPLLAEQLDMDSREQIAEALTTGVRVSDAWHCGAGGSQHRHLGAPAIMVTISRPWYIYKQAQGLDEAYGRKMPWLLANTLNESCCRLLMC